MKPKDTKMYVYGPHETTIEQINNSAGAVTYLHHDQAGSTRLITGSTGKVEGKCSYSAYGTPTCEGSATPRFGYDGQYTNSDTGLIYMRARVYDPATAQFLSRDPLAARPARPTATQAITRSTRAIQAASCACSTSSTLGPLAAKSATRLNR